MDKIRLLLVDDSIIFLDVAARFLAAQEDLDIVGTVHDSRAAYSQAKILHPNVVLLDINIPGLNGIETTPHLHQMLPEAGIIILSTQKSEVFKEAALNAGADEFLPKDTLADELIPAIHRVFQKYEQLACLE